MALSTACQPVSALGTIAPQGRIRHIAPSTSFSRVGRLHVKEGDQVQQGQIIAHSDDYELRVSELQQAEAQVAIAQSKLDKLLAGPDTHQVHALNATLQSMIASSEQRKKELERARALAKSNAIAQEELEDAHLRLTVAEYSVAELRANRELLNSIRDEDVRILKAELQAASAQVATASHNLSLSTIIAPIDGTVLRIHVREGERPSEQGILDLGDTNRMQVIAEVYEADVPKLKIGAGATIRLKSTNRVLRGTLSHIQQVVGRKSVLDNDPVSDADARVVEALIDLNQEDSLSVQSLSNARVEVVMESGS